MQLLDAINIGMRAIGYSAITSERTSNPKAGVIKACIESFSTALLTTGWWFNTIDQEIVPTKEFGTIKVPADALAIYSYDKSVRYGERDGVLYSLLTRSSRFEEKTLFKVVIDFPFEYLPEYAAAYISYKAAAEVYLNDLGMDDNVQKLEMTATMNFELLHREHLRNIKASTQCSKRRARIISNMNR